MFSLLLEKDYYIFDMDGTLTDSMVAWAITEVDTVKEVLGVDITYDKSYEAWFKIDSYLSKCDKETVDLIMKKSCDKMHDYYKTVKLKDGVREFLEFAKLNHKHMCIATNTPLYLVKEVLSRLKLDQYFEFILTCDMVGAKKTNPLIFNECIKRFNIKTSDAIIFEDSYEYTIKPKELGFNIIGMFDAAHSNLVDEFKSLANKYIYSFKELL